MGIRPRGLGLRLKSLQDHPDGAAGWGGARCPFVVATLLPFVTTFSDFSLDAVLVARFELLGVMREIRRESIGDLLLVRDLRKPGTSSSTSSSSGCSSSDCCEDVILFLAAERVVGAE